MSRIGKLPISIPKGVKVELKDSLISVEGPKGKLVQNLRPEVEVKISGDSIEVTRMDDSKTSRAFHGLTRQLVNNMIIGVSTGFSKQLIITGVGYKADVDDKKKILILSIGYSTVFEYVIPEGITITRDAPTKITVSGIDKQRVGQVAAEIRSLRKTEPYKGKGIKYSDEVIRRKAGKAGAKG